MLLAVAVWGLHASLHTSPNLPSTATLQDLSDSEVQALTQRAQAGDAQASVEMYLYDSDVRLDPEAANVWLRAAARQGNGRYRCMMALQVYQHGLHFADEPDATVVHELQSWGLSATSTRMVCHYPR